MSNTIPFSLKEPEILSQHKEFYFDEYNYYFNEREKVKREITVALNGKTISRSFKNWFRLISTKYITNPLSCKGSIENATGGRFNVGKIKAGRFPVFPALYLGNDKETCIKEVYAGMEQFYSSSTGDSFFSVNGYINSVLDVTQKGSLDKFVQVIKTIILSKALQKRAKQLSLKIESIKNVTQLKKHIYDKNWKKAPNIFDIPAIPQIFGQLVKDAGIEATLYKSTKKSRTGLCLAVFPENFKNSESYLNLEDCPKSIKNKRMDSETYESFY